MDAILEHACMIHHGNTGGCQPPVPTVPCVQHASAVKVPELAAPAHSAVQQVGRSEVMAFGSGGGKGGNLKGVQHLWAPP